jgi:hypothetical protein
MAIFYGKRTTYLVDESAKYDKAARTIGLGMSVTSAFVGAALLKIYQESPTFISFAIVFVATAIVAVPIFDLAVRRFMTYRRNQGRYLSGNAGELAVGDELAKLPDDYYVLPDVMLPAKRGNFDYVVIGPAAIFLIEVKNKAGRIYESHGKLYSAKSRFERDIVQQILNQSQRLDDYLKSPLGDYELMPVLAFSHRFANVAVKKPVQGVMPVHRSQLVEYIRTRPQAKQLDAQRALKVFDPLLTL